MKIYLDFVFFLNFFFDFLLLYGVSKILKRKAKLKRILMGSLFGALSIFLLFFNINSFTLFIIKIIISIFMVLITFSYHNKNYFFKNIFYLYIISIFLGGGLYFLNNEFSYKTTGIVFFHNGFSINIILIMIFTPILVISFIRDHKIREKYKNVYDVEIYYKNKVYNMSGFLDTGNNLKDPYKKRGIIILCNKKITPPLEEIVYVPFKTIKDVGVLKCFKTDKVIIDNKTFKNLLVGISLKASIEGIDCILPNMIREEIR